MDWIDQPIDKDEYGNPRCKGIIALHNDAGQKLASIMWFYDEGPFYCFAVDPRDEPNIIRRIGPVRGLESAKEVCLRGIEGRIDNLIRRAGYPRA